MLNWDAAFKALIGVLFALLLATLFYSVAVAQTKVEIKRINDTTYAFRYITENGKPGCWGMPQNLDMRYIPAEWTSVPDAAVDMGWPMPSPATLAACQQETWLVEPWRSGATRAVYALDGFPLTRTKIGDVEVGIPCGGHVAPYSATIKVLEWRRVTLPDRQVGVTVCRKQ